MLISAECYRDLYLDGKDENVIREEVQKLRHEMSRLKMVMESPSYPYEEHPFPSERDMLNSCRLYLSEANESLRRMNVLPERTAEEVAADDFDLNVRFIRKISLAIGTYLENHYELKIYDKYATLSRVSEERPSVDVSLDKEKVFTDIISMHIGEWHDTYLAEQYGASYGENTRWRLLIEYSDAIAPRFYEGVGVFPYNFSELRDLLGAEE